MQGCIDGKQVRGILAVGGGTNEWLLGAYLPGVGVMLFQVELGQKKGEVTEKQTGRGYTLVIYGVTSLRPDEADAHPGSLH